MCIYPNEMLRVTRANLFRISLAAALSTLTFMAIAAGDQRARTSEPARVMIIGMFHFANPGQDMVKSDVINVMTPTNQNYLAGLAERLAGFKPTDVLAECSPDEQATYDQRFKAYGDGEFELTSNETYQIGFRVAELAGLARVTCFDESKIGWDAQLMFDYMDTHDPKARAEIQRRFESLSAEVAHEQASLSLPELLKLANDPARDAVNKGLYLMTNAVGAGDGFSGADASASWWHRNFRMYANVQKAAAPSRRVIVIAGQGHTAILKDLLALDDRRVGEDVRPYFEASQP